MVSSYNIDPFGFTYFFNEIPRKQSCLIDRNFLMDDPFGFSNAVV